MRAKPYILLAVLCLGCNDSGQDDGEAPGSKRIDIFETTANLAVDVAEGPFDHFQRGMGEASGPTLAVVVPDSIPLGDAPGAGAVPFAALLDGLAPSLLGGGMRIWQEWPITVTVLGSSPSECLQPGEEGTREVDSGIRLINEAVGLEVFRPVKGRGDVCWTGSDVSISLRGLAGPRLGTSALEMVQCRGPEEERDTADATRACLPQRIRFARIQLSRLAGPQVVAHELLHTLGLSHTCMVPSAMATSFSEGELSLCARRRASLGWTTPLVLRRELSDFDVAAIRILNRLTRSLHEDRYRRVLWIPQSILE